MPNSYTTITLLSGSSGTNASGQTVYGPFDFDYINTSDIKAVVKMTSGSTFKWQSVSVASVDATTKLVTLSANLYFSDVLDQMRIYRETSLSSLVDFQSGSRISEADLDTAYRQALFVAQETAEDGSGSGTRTLQTADDIASGAITAAELATDAVETAKIKDVNVTAGKLATDAVETAKIKDLNVTAAKLAADAAETAKIKDGAVTAPKLASTLDLSGNTLTFPSGGIVQGEVDTATKTEMETEASAGICVPATLKHHPGVAAAWGIVSFDDSSPVLVAGYNVALGSPSEPSADTRRIVFSNNMATANGADYVVLTATDTGTSKNHPFVTNKTASGFDLDVDFADDTGHRLHFVVYGQLQA